MTFPGSSMRGQCATRCGQRNCACSAGSLVELGLVQSSVIRSSPKMVVLSCILWLHHSMNKKFVSFATGNPRHFPQSFCSPMLPGIPWSHSVAVSLWKEPGRCRCHRNDGAPCQGNVVVARPLQSPERYEQRSHQNAWKKKANIAAFHLLKNWGKMQRASGGYTRPWSFSLTRDDERCIHTFWKIRLLFYISSFHSLATLLSCPWRLMSQQNMANTFWISWNQLLGQPSCKYLVVPIFHCLHVSSFHPCKARTSSGDE